MVLAENGSHDVIFDTARSVALSDLKKSYSHIPLLSVHTTMEICTKSRVGDFMYSYIIQVFKSHHCSSIALSAQT